MQIRIISGIVYDNWANAIYPYRRKDPAVPRHAGAQLFTQAR